MNCARRQYTKLPNDTVYLYSFTPKHKKLGHITFDIYKEFTQCTGFLKIPTTMGKGHATKASPSI